MWQRPPALSVTERAAGCGACASEKLERLGPYFRCRACGYWGSDLPPDVTNTDAPDTEYELVSYERTRIQNYESILDMLAERHPPGSTLLEIGCADGLFLKLARERNGYHVLGIEPNTKMMGGNPHREDIRQGFFPDVLGDDSVRYDIIALNCVFEHVPAIDAMIEDFKKYLAPGGSVMVNVPVSSGFMFKVSRALFRIGFAYPFDRIWQKGFVSPHLHYFAKSNLVELFRRHEMALVAEQPLVLFSLGGLYKRLSLDPNIRLFQRAYSLGFLYAYYPVSKVAPDARAFVFTAKR